MEPETLIKHALEGRYEIRQVIGRGGMATVYKAIQISLNRPVALKVVHQNLVHDEELIKRFIREAQTCASLHHPNIVTVYDVGSVGPVHYMAMEYLEGVTLRNIIQNKGKLGVESAINFIAPIAGALDYMHHKGVIHRDIKSSNIFITDDGQPVLMDFGIVYAEGGEDLSQPGAILGTPEYMSPEQAEGSGKIDGRSDLYSLGVVIFECLTGQLPFHADTYVATLHQVMHNQVPRIKRVNPSVPIWLDSLADACLEKDRNRRIQSGIELKSALLANKFFPQTMRVDEHTTLKIDLKHQNQQDNSHLTHKSPNKTRKNLILVSLFAAIGILLVAIIFLLLNPLGRIDGIIPSPIPETLTKFTTEEPEQIVHTVKTDKEPEPGITNIVQPAEEEKDKLARVLELIQQGDRFLAKNIPSRALEEYNKALVLAPSNNQIIDKIVTATNAMDALQKSVTDETEVASESHKANTKPVAVSFNHNRGKDEEVTEKVGSSVGEPEKVTVKEAETEIYVVVEDMPSFSGGDVELFKFIYDNIKYPELAKENNIQGKVILRFCVTYKGTVDQVSVVRGVDPSLDEEAIRVIKMLPLWNPGKQGGLPVNVWYSVPISFQIK